MIRHPLTKATYKKLDDGTVLVTGIDDVSGVFDRNGNWIDGQRRIADAAMCFWVASALEAGAPASLAVSDHAVKGMEK